MRANSNGRFDVKVRSAAQQRLVGHMIAKVAADTSKMVSAPMPGLLISMAVEVGDTVEAGQEARAAPRLY